MEDLEPIYPMDGRSATIECVQGKTFRKNEVTQNKVSTNMPSPQQRPKPSPQQRARLLTKNRASVPWLLLPCLCLWVGWLWIGCSPNNPPQDEISILYDKESKTEFTAQEQTQQKEAITATDLSEAPTSVAPEEMSELHSSEKSMDAGSPEESLQELRLDKPIPESQQEETSDTKPSEQARPGKQWIGEPCSQNTDCNYTGGRCLKPSSGYPKGHCTLPCTSLCPDRAGKPVTYCIADASGQGHCVSQCVTTPCRTGYVCQLRQRVNQATRRKNVCVPRSTTPGKSVTFLYIGDSQSSGSPFAKLIVDALRNPATYCSNPNTKGNTVFSYAKVSSASRHWSELSGSSKSWLCRATKVYTNGTASSNTTGSKLCAGIISQSTSVFQKLIANHKPNAFFIQLGGNSSGFSETYVKSRIKRMLSQMPPKSLCFWVTPSYGKKGLTQRRNIEKWTKETLAQYTRIQCSVLTSIDEMSKQTTCNPFNTSDGVHMTNCGSKLWGQHIIQKICSTGKL